MPIAEVEMPDGRIAEFEVPEGTTEEQVMSFINTNMKAADEGQPDPTEGMSGIDKFLAGMGKAFVDVGRGFQQMDIASKERGANPLIGEVVPGYTEAARALSGLDPEQIAQEKAALQSDIQESRQRDAPLMETGAGTAGNIAGKVAVAAPAMAIPGGQTIAGSALVGGGLSALDPTAEGESRAGNIATGAVTAGGVTAGLKGIGRVLAPKTGEAVKKLLNEGIELTPGQILGGGAKRAEEAATSIPILGDVIKGAQKRGIESFNVAAINRSLKPIGKALEKGTPVGREAVKRAYTHINKYYDDLLPKLTGTMDDDFVKSISSATKEAIDTLPEAQAKQFDNIVSRNILSKFDETGKINGEALKDVQSRLGTFLRRYGKSENPDHQLMAEYFTNIKDSLDDMIVRLNPKQANALTGVNTSYATLLRIERAAGSTGAKEGVFTPSQLKNAIRAMDTSLRKRQFTQGGALMQDFSETAQGALAQSVPDSGTPYRLLLPYMVGGGAAYAGSEGYISPGTAAAIIAGSAAYTRPGQKILATMLTKRPDFMMKAGEAVGQAAGPVGVGVAQGTSGPDYKKIASDIKRDIKAIKSDKTLTNREKRAAVDELKKDMSGVFKEAKKSMDRKEFRELRSATR